MSSHGLSDVFTTVTIPKTEYEELVRDSERIAIVKNLLKKDKYGLTGDLKVILNIEESEDKAE